MMSKKMFKTVRIVGSVLLVLMFASAGWATDFATYDEPSSAEVDYEDFYLDLVPAGGFPSESPSHSSYFTALDIFGDDASGQIESASGDIDIAGKVLCATGNKLYVQRDYGLLGTTSAGDWAVVAEFDDDNFNMDPSFVKINSDNTLIAVGAGWGKSLFIVPVSILDEDDPPDLLTDGSVTEFESVNYYDGEWVDDRFMVINQGDYSPPYGSKVISVDTDNGSPGTYTGDDIVTTIPGASADVHYMAYDTGAGTGYAVITGNGYSGSGDTGEIMLFTKANDWFDHNNPTPTTDYDYSTEGELLADNILSAAHLDSDAENNLSVGGGNWYGTPICNDMGYAALIHEDVVARVAASGAAVTDANTGSNSEYRAFSPDPCNNDTSTGILFSGNKRELLVLWNPKSMPTNTSPWAWSNVEADPSSFSGCTGSGDCGTEYWSDGDVARLSLYLPDTPTDDDSDGVVDIADTSPY